jgi:biopolymer transport protein ExbD
MSPQTLREKAQVRLGPEEGPEFQIAPMIDILLVLLVFFLSISSTEVLQRRNGVVLPVAQGQSSPEASQAVVNLSWSSIHHTGAIEVDGQHFAQTAQFRDYLRSRTQVSPNMRVLIRADREVRYDFLRPLMVAISETGVSKVTFAVVDRDMSSTP